MQTASVQYDVVAQPPAGAVESPARTRAGKLRYYLAAAVLLVGAALNATLGEPRDLGTPRWPASDAVYAAQGWSVSPAKLDQTSDTQFVTRVYRAATGQSATLTIVTKRTPKLYVAGADVPFQGSGYTISPAPRDLVPASTNGVEAMVAARGAEQWLVIYTYGERRGLLGNGPLAWALGIWDGLLGQPNDYYKLYLSARTDKLDAALGRSLSGLAGVVFPQIAAWYAA
jgi:hypothetical protein